MVGKYRDTTIKFHSFIDRGLYILCFGDIKNTYYTCRWKGKWGKDFKWDWKG